jgi:hypothetical protein
MSRESKLTMEAFRRGVKMPAPSTLRKYGMALPDWLELLAGQGWRCPICLKNAGDVKLVTDHEHAAGWKDMTDRERAKYTRGVLCTYCNYRRVHSSISAEVAQRIADYIKAYEARTGRA